MNLRRQGPAYLCGMTLVAPHYHKAKKRSSLGFLRRDHHFVKTPWWLKRLFPGCVWDMPRGDKTLYLTFDDGPHPTITPFLLDLLKQYDAKATFFLIGDNVQKHPEIVARLIAGGHAIGNHTQQHVNGWKTETAAYLDNVDQAKKLIDSPLFRPPYGRVSRAQIRGLRQEGRDMRIIMWNILAGDWIAELSPEKCYARIKNRIRGGDIIVFHDSDKAWDRMSYAVPRLLKEFSEAGYRFEAIR